MKPTKDPTAIGTIWRVAAPTALESLRDHALINLEPGTLLRVVRCTWDYDYFTTGQAVTVHLRVLDGRAVGKSLWARAIEGLDPVPPSGFERVDA